MNSGLSHAPCNDFLFLLVFRMICRYKNNQFRMFFYKIICGGISFCKPPYCPILHLEAREYFGLCGNNTFSETIMCVNFFWTAPSCILGSKLHTWWVAAGGQGSGFECYGVFWVTMTSYTKRCTISWRVCWCKFGNNPTNTFWEICIFLCLSWVPRQGNIPDFACLTIYHIARSPELFVCLTIYENAETLSPAGTRRSYSRSLEHGRRTSKPAHFQLDILVDAVARISAR